MTLSSPVEVPLFKKFSVRMDALACVAANDIASLRLICTLERNQKRVIENTDKYGNTPLLKACFLGRYECACTLLIFGANIYAVNYFGQNALTLATYAGQLRLVMELLRRRPYHDFNLSSLVPAACVAAMQQDKVLLDYFSNLDPAGTPTLRTVHGLGIEDLRNMGSHKFQVMPAQKFFFNNSGN